MARARLTGSATVVADPEELAERAAAWLLDIAQNADDLLGLCLSGGATPQRLYERLSREPYRSAFPWSRTHWFWGDERFVPPNDRRNNYRMVREALLDRVPIPRANIHPIPTESGDPEIVADIYERSLKEFYGAAALRPDRPLFAAVLLGLGEDGHTASLFPGTPVLEERSRWAAAVPEGKPEPRITLSFPALESCREALFLVSGTQKRVVLERIGQGIDMPAARFRPIGRLRWLVDRDAAPSGLAAGGVAQ